MTEAEKFDRAMKKILSVSKVELQKRLEAEKTNRLPRQGANKPRSKSLPVGRDAHTS
jgi:hypothetical protein